MSAREPRHVVCLFEHSGHSARDWTRDGYKVFCYDIQHEHRHERDGMIYMPWNARDEDQNAELILRHYGHTALVLAFPPCTDLAASGARWWAKKKAADPDYRAKAMRLVYLCAHIGKALRAPWCLENPQGAISAAWRRPDHTFNPCEYGGYLPPGDEHPSHPHHYPPHDAYTKKTGYWVGGGFRMPEPRPVPIASRVQPVNKVGGKSARTKRIRSMSPRGVARAVWFSNRE